MQANERYYKDSGAVPIGGSLLSLVLGIGAGLVLGWLYGWVSQWNRYIILQVFGALIVGAGTGFAVNFAVMIGKVRNPWFTRIVGLVAGLTAVYAEWVGYAYGILGEWVTDPEGVVTWVQVAALAAAIANNMHQGVMYAIWGVEALSIVGIALALAGSRDLPFCEECGEWAEEFEDCALLAHTDVEKLRMDLENERYEVLDELRHGAVESDCLRATVYQCPCDGEENYLTIKHVVVTVDSDGDESRNETDVVRRLWIPDDVVERLMEPVEPMDEEPVSAAVLEEADDDEPDDLDDMFEND